MYAVRNTCAELVRVHVHIMTKYCTSTKIIFVHVQCIIFCHECTYTETAMDFRTCTLSVMLFKLLYGVHVQTYMYNVLYTVHVHRLAIALFLGCFQSLLKLIKVSLYAEIV